MDTADQGQEFSVSDEDQIEARRSIIRQSLTEIANEVGTVMRAEGLHFPLGLTVAGSGESLVSMMTQEDPSDDDWSHVTAIVCKIVSKKLGGISLRGRPLPCVVANSTMVAADIKLNTLVFDTRS